MMKGKDMQGFNFICDILSVISNNPSKKERYIKCRDTGMKFDNRMKEILVKDWAVLAWKTLHDKTELKDDIVNYYKKVSLSRIDLEVDVLQKYTEDVIEQFNNPGKRKTLSNTFNNIVVNQKGTRPYFLFGFALTIVLAAGNYADANFYIGIEEAKKLLFKSMPVLGYINAECIPDVCFCEEKNLRYLLFAALYHSLLVELPYHEDHKENNYQKGRNVVDRMLDQNVDSRLFDAMKRTTEASQIINVLWTIQDARCATDKNFDLRKRIVEEYYFIPGLIGDDETSRLLSYDSFGRVRAFVEGKEGSGKSFLAKIVVLACRNEMKDYDLTKKIREQIGLKEKRFIPMLFDCTEIDTEDIREKGILNCALDYMFLQTQEIGNKNREDSLRHFGECKNNIIQYCERKAYAGELLLLIDEGSQMKQECFWELMKKVDELCMRFPNLHVIFFGSELEHSEMKRLSQYKFFHIDQFSYTSENCEKICSHMDVNYTYVKQSLDDNPILKEFIDTPKKFLKYLEKDNKTYFQSLVSEYIEEEIASKCSYEISEYECKEFLEFLAAELLDTRKDNNELIIPEKIINQNFFIRLKGKIKHPEKIWKHVQKNRILIERAEYKNSFQFSNRINFCSILSDYFIEIIEECGKKQCSGILLDEFSKLSAEEFSMVLIFMFYRICCEQDAMFYVNINEEKFDLLFKITAGILLTYSSMKDTNVCLWALKEMMKQGSLENPNLPEDKSRKQSVWLKRLKRIYYAVISIPKGKKESATLEKNAMY